MPNYHGDDVGVCTLETLKYYNELAEKTQIETCREDVDWDAIYGFYGSMAEDVRKLNEPENIIDLVDPEALRQKWPQIVDIIHSVPSYEECKAAMEKAGCKLTVADIGKDEKFFRDCMYYSPFMRRRMTLLRMKHMIR